MEDHNIKKMASMLRSGATMLDSYCPQCENILFRLKDNKKVLVFEEFINSLPNTKIQPVDYNVAKLAASLRGEYNLRTPDSIILSTALITHSEAFITNDIFLKKLEIKNIKILILDEYL